MSVRVRLAWRPALSLLSLALSLPSLSSPRTDRPARHAPSRRPRDGNPAGTVRPADFRLDRVRRPPLARIGTGARRALGRRGRLCPAPERVLDGDHRWRRLQVERRRTELGGGERQVFRRDDRRGRGRSAERRRGLGRRRRDRHPRQHRRRRRALEDDRRRQDLDAPRLQGRAYRDDPHPSDQRQRRLARGLRQSVQAGANRGVFKTTDGGKTFSKTLFVNDSTGAIDIQLDPSNPDVLYAATWQAYRTSWSLSSGGLGSGIWKSTDGGNSWTNLNKTAQGTPHRGDRQDRDDGLAGQAEPGVGGDRA